MTVQGSYSPNFRAISHWTALMAVLVFTDCVTSSPALRHPHGTAIRQLLQVSVFENEQHRRVKANSVPLTGSQGHHDGDTLIESETSGSRNVVPSAEGGGILTSAKYLQCYHELEEASSDKATLTRSDFVRFLSLVSNGALAFDSFAQLPSVFEQIFYSVAIGSSAKDRTSPRPALSLEATPQLESFCEEIQWYTFTSTAIGFDFSVRYNPQQLSSKTMSTCLSSATEALLKAHFGCNNDSISAGQGLANTPKDAGIKPSTAPPLSHPMLRRPAVKEVLACPFTIHHQVNGIIPFRKSHGTCAT
ncbi:hypothetical protein MPSEU_000735700 [Mayamaea pseudoterrestris]|nr:hypothetical protein MPSEU_000735700 [Mayamaea pseudoterrestris]